MSLLCETLHKPISMDGDAPSSSGIHSPYGQPTTLISIHWCSRMHWSPPHPPWLSSLASHSCGWLHAPLTTHSLPWLMMLDSIGCVQPVHVFEQFYLDHGHWLWRVVRCNLPQGGTSLDVLNSSETAPIPAKSWKLAPPARCRLRCDAPSPLSSLVADCLCLFVWTMDTGSEG